ncbi:uncharacterized protein [Amphiura filiformis]|uniref:uncharacterized protein n=1 Tax=Amphiura filiformis TaxID=82378 RepID=UPI003B2202F4
MKACEAPPKNLENCKRKNIKGQCCPEYDCSCEDNGNNYKNGQKIKRKDACEQCHCSNGRVTCVTEDCRQIQPQEGCKLEQEKDKCCRVLKCSDGPTPPLPEDCGFCPKIFRPVCGSDGETYTNKCEMKREFCLKQVKDKKGNADLTAVTVAEEGECKAVPDKDCKKNGVRYKDGDAVKQKNPCEHCTCLDGTIECAVMSCLPPPQANCKAKKARKNQCCPSWKCPEGPDPTTPGCEYFCPANFDPVCGSDGETYSNECELGRAGCISIAEGKEDISFAYKGECNKDALAELGPPPVPEHPEECFTRASKGKDGEKVMTPLPALDPTVPSRVEFRVQAKQNVIVQLYEDDSINRYEIRVGASDNSMTVVYRCSEDAADECDQLYEFSTPNILNPKRERSFFIVVYKSRMQFGNVDLLEPYFDKDPSDGFPIKNVAFTTDGQPAYWCIKKYVMDLKPSDVGVNSKTLTTYGDNKPDDFCFGPMFTDKSFSFTFVVAAKSSAVVYLTPDADKPKTKYKIVIGFKRNKKSSIQRCVDGKCDKKKAKKTPGVLEGKKQPVKFSISFSVKDKSITLSKLVDGKSQILVVKDESKKDFLPVKCALFANQDDKAHWLIPTNIITKTDEESPQETLRFEAQPLEKFTAKEEDTYKDNYALELQPYEKAFSFCVAILDDGTSPRIALDSVQGGTKYELVIATRDVEDDLVTRLFVNGEMKEEEYSDRKLGKKPICLWISIRNGVFRLGHKGDVEECLYHEDPEVEVAQFASFSTQGGTTEYEIMKYPYFTEAGDRLETFDPAGVYMLSFSNKIVPRGQSSCIIGFKLVDASEVTFAIAGEAKDGLKQQMALISFDAAMREATIKPCRVCDVEARSPIHMRRGTKENWYHVQFGGGIVQVYNVRMTHLGPQIFDEPFLTWVNRNAIPEQQYVGLGYSMKSPTWMYSEIKEAPVDDVAFNVVVGGAVKEDEMFIVRWKVVENAYMALTDSDALKEGGRPTKLEIVIGTRCEIRPFAGAAPVVAQNCNELSAEQNYFWIKLESGADGKAVKVGRYDMDKKEAANAFMIYDQIPSDFKANRVIPGVKNRNVNVEDVFELVSESD